MKKILLALFALSLFYFGCSDSGPNVNPISSNTSSKTAIMLPSNISETIQSNYFVSQVINGNNGGSIELHDVYLGKNGNVTFDGKLSVPAGAFSGSKNINMQIGNFAGIDFSPSMVFNIPLSLTLKITGLDLQGVDPNSLNFYYLAPDGSTQLVQSDSIIVDVQSGTLEVINARLPHFSRYTWAK
ncbi:MAG: hypothetical protein ACYDA4_00945 [Ignavibacteriaceae bacterium]